jgi:hypothetical protein
MAHDINLRVKKHRDALRASGLRPIQIWVPDTRRVSFKKECRKQIKRIANDQQENEILDWIDKASDTEGWE